MHKYQNIKSVEIEITTHCNAACPQCPRNHHGGATIESLPKITWTLDDAKKILPIDFIQQLENLYICGTYGDAMASQHVLDIVQWLRLVNPKLNIGLHTNGSIGAVSTYQQLAPLLDYMVFGIDGLEDTNHIYRRRTKWSTIMRNAQAFINAGGTAYWDYIVFKHNEHQVELALELSNAMGFKKFNIKKTYRFFNRNHQMQSSLQVINAKGDTDYIIEPPTNQKYLNNLYTTIKQVDLVEYQRTTKISCWTAGQQLIYIGADGYVFPCGWLHDRLYGVEVEGTYDHNELHLMMQECGGNQKANAFYTPLNDIIDGAWFDKISQSWPVNRLQRCAMMCGEKLNVIGIQNELLQY